jgi:hypothetical protein
MIFHMLCQKYVAKEGRGINDYILPDFFHKFVKKTEFNSNIYLIINDLAPLLIVIYFLSMCALYIGKFKAGDILIESQLIGSVAFWNWLFSISILYFLRAIFFTSTILPDSSKKCNENSAFGGCNDLLFSGHIAISVLTLLYTHHFYQNNYIFRIISVLYISFLSFLILANRNHYTIDVILGILIPYFIFTSIRLKI